MQVPSYDMFLDRNDIQDLKCELENAYMLLDEHSGLKAYSMEEFIDEYLDAHYDAEVSHYMCQAYHDHKEDKWN